MLPKQHRFSKMIEKEYRFNPDTLTYEPVKEPARRRRSRYVRRAAIGFAVLSVLNLLYGFLFYTPKMRRLDQHNNKLLRQYDILDSRINATSQKIAELKQRDNNVYRALFAADTLDIAGIYSPYPDSCYSFLRSYRYGDMIERTSRRLDQTARLLYLESISLDQLQLLSKDKEYMAWAIPAIWPINRRDLKGDIGAFGMRLHPIYHVMKRHTGIDLGGYVGAPVYVTGNGKVEEIVHSLSRQGYGNQIVVDHGFGYKTRYAHLSRIDVEAGQYVTRGEQIGAMGSTGASTAPHLHYEVIFLNERVNPINYFRRDMSEEEFEQVIESAKATTFETDRIDDSDDQAETQTASSDLNNSASRKPL